MPMAVRFRFPRQKALRSTRVIRAARTGTLPPIVLARGFSTLRPGWIPSRHTCVHRESMNRAGDSWEDRTNRQCQLFVADPLILGPKKVGTVEYWRSTRILERHFGNSKR